MTIFHKKAGQHSLNYPPSFLFRYLERHVRILVYLPHITGQLSVGNLDYETHKSYNLVVEASDGSHSAKANVNVVVVDTNDPPHFKQDAFVAVLDEG